ncbi:lipopolysaccharide biosynthesis protein, partial [Pseudomonadota bacterium]
MAIERDPETMNGLKHAAVRGGVLLLSGRVVNLLLNIVSMLVLARLLVPEDFGLFAMVAVLMNFLVIFTDPGLSAVTMQRQNITQQQISNLFWVNAGLGLVLALLMLLLAPLLLWFYGDDRLFSMVWALASVFLITGLGIQHEALLRREMRFRKLVILELAALVGSITVGLSFAVNGAGYWALVAMPISAAVLKTMSFWLFVDWTPHWPARNAGTRSLLAFGGHLTASNLITYLMKNLDDMLIGWRWGAASLGLYSMAYRLFLLPVQQIAGSLGSVAIVSLSRLTQKRERFKSFYLRMVMAIAYVSMPLVMWVGLLSDEVFLLFLGEEWSASADIFSVFACTA